MVASSGASRGRQADDRRRGAIVASLALGTLSYALLQSLVVPALLEIQRTTGASLGEVGWVITAYLLAATVGTPLIGRLGDLHGKKRWLLIALGCSAVGSLIAALAPSLGVLILARLIQGLAGGVFPLAFSIIRDEMPHQRVPGAIGLVSATGGIGLAIGVVLAGPIVATLGWHWLFWFQLALSGTAIAFTAALVPESPQRAEGQLDWGAAVLMAIGLSALLFAIGETTGSGWGSPNTLVPLTVGLAVSGCWIARELRSGAPLVDMRLMLRPEIWSINLVAFLLGAGTYTAFVLIPQYIEALADHGGLAGATMGGGLALLPCTVTAFACSAGFGRTAAAIGSRGALVVGAAATAATFAALLAIPVAAAAVYVASALLGVGLGFAYAALGVLAVMKVPVHRSGVVGAMNYVLRVAGGAFGTQVAATLVAGSASGARLAVADFEQACLVMLAVALAAVGVTLAQGRRGAQNG